MLEKTIVTKPFCKTEEEWEKKQPLAKYLGVPCTLLIILGVLFNPHFAKIWALLGPFYKREQLRFTEVSYQKLER
jgi:hypothetical protein